GAPPPPEAGPPDRQRPLAHPARARRLRGRPPPPPAVPAAPRPHAATGAHGTVARLNGRMPSRTLATRSEDETRAEGRALARVLRAGDVVLLSGDLGMGKTVFARGLAQGLGVPDEEVRSPSFTLVNRYRGPVTLYHIDLYRIDRPEDL